LDFTVGPEEDCAELLLSHERDYGHRARRQFTQIVHHALGLAHFLHLQGRRPLVAETLRQVA
jgi:hypothetical protein